MYRCHSLEWTKARKLARFGANTFEYNASGIRIKKNDTVYTLAGTKILKETTGSNTITYYYGTGIAPIGFNYNGTDYYFRKNIQGDVVAIYDTDGDVVAKYVYDAWGNHKIYDANNNEVTSTSHIGYINPIRYRGYYFDVETNLYYLQTRYYDPETGRFLNSDAIEYLAPEQLGGLNLYAYCNNNPVVFSDYFGNAIDVALDIGFICLDVVSLMFDDGWKDWKNWVALGADIAFAVLPFATGGGQVIKLANVADDLSDMSKVTVIGETMARVKTVSQFVNAADNLYDGLKSYDKLKDIKKIGKIVAEVSAKSHNIAWLYGKLRSGYNIIDIGIDVSRVSSKTGKLARSSSYIAERIVLTIWDSRNFWKYLFHLF